MSTVIFLSLHDLGVMFLFGAFVAGVGLLLAEVAWRWEQRSDRSIDIWIPSAEGVAPEPPSWMTEAEWQQAKDDGCRAAREYLAHKRD